MDGLILINKEKDWTSRDVCNVIQKIHHTKKVGHTGTLDPFAEGLLIVTINKANKIGQFLDDFTKTYIATLKLGKKTSTGDLTGDVIGESNLPSLNENKIEEVLKSFLGEIEQIPPMTSAIHFKGRKLYEYYYEGLEIQREARTVNIHNIKLITFKEDEIVFEAEVSKGTYIRVLGENIAEKLNTVGHLTSLIRTKIGPFDLNNAIKLRELDDTKISYSIGEALAFLPTITVDNDIAKKVKDGMHLRFENVQDDLIYIKSIDDTPLAIYERKQGDVFKCKRGIW